MRRLSILSLVTCAALMAAACGGKVTGTIPTGGDPTGDPGGGDQSNQLPCPVIEAEICDGLDNNCDGQYDEGCTCTDSDTQPCGSDAGECVAGVQTCSGGAWGECAGVVGPAFESCDGLDNDCDGDVDEGCPCTENDTQPCGSDVGECVAGLQTCTGGVWGACADEVGPTAESCDGLDNDCDEAVDDGCDDDGDDYCDAALTVVGTPAVCPNSAADTGDDCDDDDPTINPGAAEVCDDLIDNDCDELTDLEDATGCPAINVTIEGEDPRRIPHGATQTVRAVFTPTDPEQVWPRVWTVLAAEPSVGCATGDLTLGAPVDSAGATQVPVTVPDDPAKLGCAYTLEARVNGYAFATVEVRMVNAVPRITELRPALEVDGAWSARVPAGSTPTFIARANNDPDAPLSFRWAGDDLAQLSCAGTACVSSDDTQPFESQVQWAAPATAGSYQLTVFVHDAFGGGEGSAALTVEVDACVWVAEGGSGDGSAATSPLGVIQAGLDLAKESAGTAVCVTGDGQFDEDLVVPASPNAPDLLGGFATNGTPDLTRRPIIVSSAATGLRFATGYAGELNHLALRQSSAGAAAVTVREAAPVLVDCQITLAGGAGPIGVVVEDDLAGPTAPTRLTMRAGWLRTAAGGTATTDATGVRLRNVGGGEVSAALDAVAEVSVVNCNGTCRGLDAGAATELEVRRCTAIRARSGDGSAVAIDLAGSNSAGVAATIEENGAIYAESAAIDAVAIRLSRAAGVRIAGNATIGNAYTGGTGRLAAGIADGLLLRDGTVTPGGSTRVTIADNAVITGGGGTLRCTNPGDTGEGVDVAAGVLLVGTRQAEVTGNGQPLNDLNGVYGGITTDSWDPATRALPPAAVGLWLVDASGALVEGNELRAGVVTHGNSCPAPTVVPAAVAVRDGLPPNPAFGGAELGPRQASIGAVFDRNGASCARPPNTGGVGFGRPNTCVALELCAAPAPVDALTLVVNNVLAATKGDRVIGYAQHGGHAIVLANNLIDVDYLPGLAEPPIADGVLKKRAVQLSEIGANSLQLINNILYVHADGDADDLGDRWCLWEANSAGNESRLRALEHNLFFIEGALGSGTDYVRVEGQLVVLTYDDTELNDVAGVDTIGHNLAALPGLREGVAEWEKSAARLVAGSAAIDAGKAIGGGVPTHDIDGEIRPNGGGVDIGHDELH